MTKSNNHFTDNHVILTQYMFVELPVSENGVTVLLSVN